MSTGAEESSYLKLLAAAREAAENSYVPYSNRPCGAAVLAENGQIYTGCSVEFATYNGSIAAETAAIVRAANEGARRFQALAIHPPRWPAGDVRQFLMEFGAQLDVVVAGANDNLKVVPLKDLLPNSFGPADLATVR